VRLGVFGGTFDPPHIGQLILASEAYDQLQLDRLLWVLTPNPPHKQGHIISPLEIRLEMVVSAIQDNPAFELSRVEIDRPAPHYALDTVKILAKENPAATLVYLIGGDSLSDLPDWHRSLEFLEACDELGVMRRPGEAVDLNRLETVLPGIKRKVKWIDAPLLEISSSQIRQRVAEGRTYCYYVPRPVYQIIQSHSLYQA